MRVATYRISSLLGIDVLEGNGEVDEIKVDVAETPSLVLGLGHGHSMFFSVVVVPQLGGNEDILALHETLLNGSLDTLTGLLLVLVVVSTVEEAVTGLDGLRIMLAEISMPWDLKKLTL